MNFRIGTTLAISGLVAVTICGAVVFGGPRPTVAAASAGLAAVVEDALAVLGGTDVATARAADYDRAVAVGIPLADAQLTEAEYRDFAAAGSNVVIPCEIGSATGAEVNAIFALTGGEATAVPCAGFNPDAPAVSVDFGESVAIAASSLTADEKSRLLAAGYDEVGPCDADNGRLSELLADAGGSSWICGRTSGN